MKQAENKSSTASRLCSARELVDKSHAGDVVFFRPRRGTTHNSSHSERFRRVFASIPAGEEGITHVAIVYVDSKTSKKYLVETSFPQAEIHDLTLDLVLERSKSSRLLWFQLHLQPEFNKTDVQKTIQRKFEASVREELKKAYAASNVIMLGVAEWVPALRSVVSPILRSEDTSHCSSQVSRILDTIHVWRQDKDEKRVLFDVLPRELYRWIRDGEYHTKMWIFEDEVEIIS